MNIVIVGLVQTFMGVIPSHSESNFSSEPSTSFQPEFTEFDKNGKAINWRKKYKYLDQIYKKAVFKIQAQEEQIKYFRNLTTQQQNKSCINPQKTER